MGVAREPTYSLLAVAAFSRHPEALTWATAQLTGKFGKIALISPNFSFHQTTYYQATMGSSLAKRFLIFDEIVPAGCLPEVKRLTIALETEIAASGRFPEVRPLNLDPGLVQLG